MSVALRWVEGTRRGQIWTLDLSPEKATLRDGSGAVVLEYTPEEATRYFQLPSFSESIKYFGIASGTSFHRYDVSKEGLREIRNFLHQSLAGMGPDAIQALRNAAIRDVLIGVCLVAGGLVITIGGYVLAANNPNGGSYRITFGAVFFGFVMLGKGIYRLAQYRRVSRLAEAQEWTGVPEDLA